MKKNVWIVLICFWLIICTLFYIKYDRDSFYSGYGCRFCKEELPYNLKPHDGSQFSFTLKDEDDFELVGIGFRYQKSSFTINNLLAYGYNDTSVVIKCTDSLKEIKYLISYPTGYKSLKGNPEISFKDLSNSKFELLKDQYQFQEIDEEKADIIGFLKAVFAIGTLLPLFLIVREFIVTFRSY